MKKGLALILVAIMSIGLVACGSSDKSTEGSLSTTGLTVDGAIGDATGVKSKTLSLSDYADLASYVADKTTGSVVYDITLKDKDGKAVQPKESVNVTVNTEGIADKNSAYAVYYVAKDGAYEKMEVTKTSAKSVTFKTTHFSVYAILAYDKDKFSDENFLKDSEAVAAAAKEAEAAAETTEAAASEGGYTYTDKSGTLYATQTMNVRNQPDPTGEKVGSVSAGTALTVTGQCNETGWYRISYGGGTAFVSNSYVSTEKPAAQQQSAGNAASQQPAGDNGGGNAASAPSGGGASSGTTLEENVAFAASLGYSTTSITWISDTDYYIYCVHNRLGYGFTMPPYPDRIVNAEIDYDSAVDVYSDANMVVIRYTGHCY